MSALAAALEAACAGRGGVVFVVGEAGIGKSRLVHEVSALAAARGLLILRGRAVPGSGGVAFRPLAEALAAVVSDAGLSGRELGPWLPVLASIVPASGPPGAGVEASAPVLGEAVLRLLRALCTPDGGLLVLEDLHWADPETLAIVEHLSDNLERAPVLCVVTVRVDEHSRARDLVRRVTARRAAHVLELGHLNQAQVAAMIYSCTGGSGVDAVDRLVKLSDGVPFLVEEILVSPGLPTSFADAVEARLAQLPDHDRLLLATAAAFGRHFDWRLLSSATGLAEDDVVDALERGVAAQLLVVEGDGFRFRHALTAEAAFQSMIPPRRQKLAAAALAAVEAAHDEVPAEMRHVVARLAERAGQLERAGRLQFLSGAEALDRGALHTAIAALEQASRLLPAGDGRDRTGERLVDALALAGRLDAALALGRELIDRLPRSRAAAVHLRLAGAAVIAARWDVAGQELAAAQALVQAGASPALRAELAIRQAELAIDTNDSSRAGERAGVALELARSVGMPEVECAALQLLGRCERRSSLQRAEVWFREALRVAEMHRLPLWRLRALHEIGTIGLLDRSDVSALVEAQALAESVGALATAAILDVELAAGYGSRHDLEAEARHGSRAVQRGTQLGLDLVVAYGWHHVAGAAVLAGDHERAGAAAAAARAAAPGNTDVEGLLVGACELMSALLADDRGSAVEAAQRCTELLRGSQTAPPAHFRTAWPLLLALNGFAQAEAEAAVVEMEGAGLAVNRGGRGSLAMARAMIAGRSDPARAAALAADADEQLVDIPLWRYIVRRLGVEAAAIQGWAVPEGWAAEAEQWLRSHGYPAIADACHAGPSPPPSSLPSAWTALGVTRREADVLSLVVEGCPNREIAERLYLSVRTVEKHVESLLRKTGTRTRTQLARVAADT